MTCLINASGAPPIMASRSTSCKENPHCKVGNSYRSFTVVSNFASIETMLSFRSGSRGGWGGSVEPPRVTQANILTILFLVKKDLLNNNNNKIM